MRPPESRASLWLMGITIAAWLAAAVLGRSEEAAIAAGFIPARFSGVVVTGALPAWLTPLSATLVHGGVLHLGLNMLMLGYCGRFVEYALGWKGLLIVYGVGAYAAAAAQYFAGPDIVVPMIGASGAISGVVGAYALLFSRRRGASAEHPLGNLLHILWLAAAWIFVQLLVGLASAGAHLSIAIAAHIGGFIAGLALAQPLLRLRWRK